MAVRVSGARSWKPPKRAARFLCSSTSFSARLTRRWMPPKVSRKVAVALVWPMHGWPCTVMIVSPTCRRFDLAASVPGAMALTTGGSSSRPVSVTPTRMSSASFSR